MPADLGKLEAAAKAATPGPWEAVPASYGWDIWANAPDVLRVWVGPVVRLASPHHSVYDGSIEADTAFCAANAALIALANPAAILDLVERVRKAEADSANALMEAEARGYERAKEQAARVADAAAASADRKFAGVIKRHQKGERNLELAASTAAGMDHEARNIATAIRNMGNKTDE